MRPHNGASGPDGGTITVGRAKTSSGTGRMIPINDDLGRILAQRQWFWGKPLPSDPARHAADITSRWDQLRKGTAVPCRLNDLITLALAKQKLEAVPVKVPVVERPGGFR